MNKQRRRLYREQLQSIIDEIKWDEVKKILDESVDSQKELEKIHIGRTPNLCASEINYLSERVHMAQERQYVLNVVLSLFIEKLLKAKKEYENVCREDK